MVVCHCHRVNDAAIRSEVRMGALTSEEIARRCGAGSTCGGCRPAVDAIVDRLLADDLDANPSVALHSFSSVAVSL
jgi:bacterioferritin-associated ferredoxin